MSTDLTPYLEMDTRTENSFKAVEENRVFVEVFTECLTGLFGMDETHVYSFIYELGEQSEEWQFLFADFDV